MRVPLLDALRGAAILLVVLNHVTLKTSAPFNGGMLGLDLSFFVSGFCLMLVYVQHMVDGKSFQGWGLYASRRFWKIVPSYYLALLPIALWFPFEARQGITRANDVFLHLSFLYPFNDASFFSLNGNYWSLGVEVEFYVLFPLFVLAFIRWPWIASGVVAAIGFAYIAFVVATGRFDSAVWSFGVVAYLPLFAFGAVSSYVYGRWIRTADVSRSFRLVMTALSVAFLGAIALEMVRMQSAGVHISVWTWAMDHRLEIGVLFSAFTLSTLAALPAWHEVFANPVLRFYADVSYNVYLWNAPIIALITLVWLNAPFWLLLPVVVVATTAVAFGIHRFFELPLMRLGARLARARPDLAQEFRRHHPQQGA
jgi:peptidoglycan/LPS O-acetylase OafA/YrhL